MLCMDHSEFDIEVNMRLDLLFFFSAMELCGAVMIGEINRGVCLLQSLWNMFISDYCIDFVECHGMFRHGLLSWARCVLTQVP